MKSIKVLTFLVLALPLFSAVPAAAGDKNADTTRIPYYVPHLLPSVDDAASKLRFLQPHLFSNGVVAQQIFVDQNGVNVSFSQQGVNVQSHYFWAWNGGYNAPVSTPYNNQWSFSAAYSTVRLVSAFQSPHHPGMGFLEVATAETVNYLNADSIENTHMLFDAIVTLIVASGNTDFCAFADFDIDPAPQKELQKELKKLKADAAWTVATVQQGGPADIAGIHKGDIVYLVDDGSAMRIWTTIRKRLQQSPSGYTVKLGLMRDKVPVTVSVTYKAPWTAEQIQALQARTAAMAHANAAQASAPAAPPAPGGVKLGVRAHNISAAEVQTAGLADAKGIFVDEITKDGIADQAKLQPGDIILAIDGKPLATIEQMKVVLQAGAPTTIKIWRRGEALTLAISESM
jgi:membrane-associated protease RseP (regulator of RpoE activity)